MQNRPNGSTTSSFKNPFDDYNANVLDPELIMQYWYTPFSTGALKEFDEKRFFTQKMPIVLQGSRGSGKTTILKYFSFPVQCERAKQGNLSIMQQLIFDEGIGFYFRCDDSFLKEFKSVFSIAVKENWTACFEHYLELFFVKNLITLINGLNVELSNSIGEEILRTASLSTLHDDFVFSSIELLDQYISSEIRYINTFKNEVLFTQSKFAPQHVWSMYDISSRLIGAISTTVPSLSKLNYLLLVDEFENLPVELQKLFNTMIKFCRADVSMRVGRRSENIVTKETVNVVEYLREQHDYCLIVLDQEQDIQTLKPYLLGIAAKRLQAIEGTNISSNIIDVLGDKEDLDAECDSIANHKNLHLKYLLSANPRINSDKFLLENIISVISYPQNRLAEMLNALWVSRCNDKENPMDIAQFTVGAMNAFFSKGQHPLLEKYENDYKNKYRYALTVLVCTAYRKDKAYYGFNTICYLSEGNARTFINLCKAIISDAFFYEKKSFLDSGSVSKVSQYRAIKNYSTNEFNSVCSIIQNGNAIREFILSIGNVFSEYHKDRLVRYPETNQFIYTPDDLTPDARDILDIAISWSLIKRRKETQRLSAGIAKEGDLYRINRVFAPIFNISYRTRGGVNVVLAADEIQEMISGQYTRSKLGPTTTKKRNSPAKRVKEVVPSNQLSLFDLGGFE